MGNRLSKTSRQATRRSSPSATKDVVALPSTSLQGGTTPPPPPPQGPRNDEGQEAVLRKAIRGLREHVPELYLQLRAETPFNSDVLKIVLDIVHKVSGGMPWPVALALQAVLLIADNASKVHENAAAQDSLTSKVQDLKKQLESLKDLGVRDEDKDQVKEIALKLIAASAVVDDVVGRRASTRTCGTCFRAFVCAQYNAKKLSDVGADLEKCLVSITGILTSISTYRTERPCRKAPELPSHLVRMEEPVSKVMEFLRDSGGSTRVVGLHGQAGIGKTTLMRVVEARLKSDSQDDDGSRTTHKIASVEVGMEPPSLKKLQKSLYSQLSDGSNESFSSEAQGRVALKELMERLKGRNKKICLFLDNVWKVEHLNELLPQANDLAGALPHGSYLLISSRSENVAVELAVMCFKTEQEQKDGYFDYKLSMLPQQDAEDLFLRMASRGLEEQPLQRDDQLVKAIVPLCGGLPLALTVYGSMFKDGKRRKPGVWKRVLEQLERAEDPCFAKGRVFQKLKASVEFQDGRLQDVFLDVAHLSRFGSPMYGAGHNYRDYDYQYIGKALDLAMEEGDLNDLLDQSLVTRRGERLVIHDLMLNVAKQMAKEKKVWFVTPDTSEDEIAELLLQHPQVPVPSIRAFDERVWCKHVKKSYPPSAQMQDVRYLILKESRGHPLVNQRREFGLMITKHCRRVQVLVVDFLGVQEQLSWITSLKQLRWLSLDDYSFRDMSKADMRNLLSCLCLRPIQRQEAL